MSEQRFPQVFNEHGAPQGIDWRRVPGMALESVPGRIDVRNVMPGDTVHLDGQDVVVHKVEGPRSASAMHLITRTAGGAQIVLEAVIGEQVDVVAVGAFDPAGADS